MKSSPGPARTPNNTGLGLFAARPVTFNPRSGWDSGAAQELRPRDRPEP